VQPQLRVVSGPYGAGALDPAEANASDAIAQRPQPAGEQDAEGAASGERESVEAFTSNSL